MQKKSLLQVWLICSILSTCCLTVLKAQQPKIPNTMYFAGMKLNISNDAADLIMKDYLMIVKNSKYFSSIVQRADLYFPIIEKVFEEEEAPADFKFLALQESSLQSDAISKSLAVGYWQFKRETAIENGLQIDHLVDERKNIVASSRAACRYLKKNNAALRNWVYTLLSYYLGRGGVAPYVKEKYQASNEMDIDKDMNWYVIRFLAHKYAYERVVGQVPHPQLRLSVYTDGSGKSLSEIANDKKIELSLLSEYNKWLNTPEVPTQKPYAVILPYTITNDLSGQNIALSDKTNTKLGSQQKNTISSPTDNVSNSETPMIVEHNKLKAIQARVGDSFAKLANQGNISLNQFLGHNELQSYDKPLVGQLYYLEAKRSKALVLTHTVQPNETLWSIAQLYGIRMANIRKKNRMRPHENIKAGQVLWLKKKLPKDVDVKRKKEKVAKNAPYFVQDKEVPEIDNGYKPSPFSVPSSQTQSQTKPVDTSIAPTKSASSPDTLKMKPSTINPTNIKVADTSKTLTVEKISDNVINKTILQDSTTTHIVKTGETLYRISKIYNVSVDSIKVWNKIGLNEISVNQAIKIIFYKKLNPTYNPNEIVHEVKPSETLYKISRDYGVRVEQIMEWNNKKTNTVSVGEKIIIIKNNSAQ